MSYLELIPTRAINCRAPDKGRTAIKTPFFMKIYAFIFINWTYNYDFNIHLRIYEQNLAVPIRLRQRSVICWSLT